MKYSTKIGLTAGLVMVLMSLGIFYYTGSFESQFEILIYAFYCGSVMFVQYKHKKNTSEAGFKSLFSEGFKVFVVVTFMMVIFTWIFLKTNPSFQQQVLDNYKNNLITSGNRTQEQITTEMAQAGEKYMTFITSMAIFGYLAIGSLAAMIGGFFFSSRYKK